MSIQSKCKLIAEDGIVVDDSLIMFARDVNLLYSMNLKTEEIKIIGCIPEGKKTSRRMCTKILEWNNRLIFIPMNMKNVWIYNCIDSTWKSIEIKGSGKNSFMAAEIYAGKLFMIGTCFDGIVRINLENDEVKYIQDIYAELSEYVLEKKDCFIRTHIVRLKNYLYMASCVSNHVLCLNMESETWEWKRIGKETNQYSGIAWDGKEFWLAPRRNGSLVKWNGKNEYIEIGLPNVLRNAKCCFMGIAYDGKEMTVPGMSGSCTIRFLPECCLTEKDMQIEDESYTFYKAEDEGGLIAMTVNGEIILCSEKDREKRISCIGDVTDFLGGIDESYFDSPYVESEVIDLNILIDVINK